MRRFHIIFGLIMFVIFLITGQLMEAHFPDKETMSQHLRLLMRSRHIYILFASLIHLAMGVYLLISDVARTRYMQYAGSAFLTIASGLLIWAFFEETYSVQGYSEFSRFGIYLSAAGVLLHLLSGIERR